MSASPRELDLDNDLDPDDPVSEVESRSEPAAGSAAGNSDDAPEGSTDEDGVAAAVAVVTSSSTKLNWTSDVPRPPD